MSNFYANPDNLLEKLTHFMSIYSEDRPTAYVPVVKDIVGKIDVIRTFSLSAYRDFPSSEKQIWINNAVNSSSSRI